MIILISSKITTLAQDDTVIDEVTQSGSEPITTGVSAIGERKKVYARFTIEDAVDPAYQLALLGSKLYANIGLFLPTGVAAIFDKVAPNAGFSIAISPDLSPSETPTASEMAFYCVGNSYPESVRNLNAWFYYYDTNEFAIEIEYYNRFDENGYTSNVSKGTEYSFISEQWNESNTKIIDSSVYSVAKDVRLFTFIENALVEGFEQHYSEAQETVLITQQVSRHDSRVEYYDENGDLLTSLSSIHDQTITVRFYSTNDALEDIYAKLIRIQEDQAYSFIDNYAIVENLIDPANVEDNFFVGPFTKDYDSYGGYWELTFTTDHTYLTAGTGYRLLFSGYQDAMGGVSSSQGIGAHISAVNVLPYCLTPCPTSVEFPINLEFTGSIIDLHDEYLGNSLTAAIEERLRTKLIVDFSDNRWKNNIDCRLGNDVGGDTTVSNDIRKYLNGVELEFFESSSDPVLGGTVKNTLVKEFINKTGVNTFSSPNIAFTFDMSTEKLTMTYDFRNRNDQNLPALFSFLNGTPYLPVIGNQYWGGKQLSIRWSLVFYYNDFPTPFTDTLYFTQTLNVRDYSNDVTITNFDKTVFCNTGSFCLEAAIVFASPSNYRLIATRQQSSGLLVEAESFAPDNLGQQTDLSIPSMDINYGTGAAQFCMDGSQLLVGNTYKLSAMAKKWL